MRLVRMIFDDIRKRKNLDGYIAALVAIVISFLGIISAVNLTVVSSAILAILTFISIWLIQNRHENQEIRLGLSRVDDLRSLFEIFASSTSTSVTHKVVPRGEYIPTLQYFRRLVSEAAEEVLVLDYKPLSPDDVFDPDDMNNIERQKYHGEVIKKIRGSRKGCFRYRRIVQVPAEKDIADLLKDDPIFREHCEIVVELGKRQPDIVSLRRCDILFHGTIMIIDRKILIVSIDITDPDDQTYYDSGYFQFYDSGQNIIKQFVQYFDRAYAKASLVGPEDL